MVASCSRRGGGVYVTPGGVWPADLDLGAGARPPSPGRRQRRLTVVEIHQLTDGGGGLFNHDQTVFVPVYLSCIQRAAVWRVSHVAV